MLSPSHVKLWKLERMYQYAVTKAFCICICDVGVLSVVVVLRLCQNQPVNSLETPDDNVMFRVLFYLIR